MCGYGAAAFPFLFLDKPSSQRVLISKALVVLGTVYAITVDAVRATAVPRRKGWACVMKTGRKLTGNRRSYRVMSAATRNVSECRRVQIACRDLEERYSAIISALPDIVLRVDKTGTIKDIHVPRGFFTLLDGNHACGQGLREVLPGDLADRYLENVLKALDKGEPQTFTYKIFIDGKERFREARVSGTKSRQEALLVIRDVTESQEAENRLQEISIKDPLTGVYNRRFFEDELRRHGGTGQAAVGIVVCDVDGLKLVNDSLGQITGDMHLKVLAGILAKCFRQQGIIARMGGDEFAVLLPDCNGQMLESLSQRLRTEIKECFASERSIPFTVSIGCALSDGRCGDIAGVLREAEDNMYREKFHSSQSTRSAMIEIVMRLLKARDLVTEQHLVRIEDLLVAFGTRCGLQHNRLSTLRLLAKFHDIGKVGIPDRVLFKPGKLTVEEFQEVKRHSEIGYRIARASAELSPLADFILKHHERWDGTGYPLGLKGTEIPLEARLLAIADAFDAMTNDRPYRKAMTVAEALSELKLHAGTQFDSALVAVFCQLIDSKAYSTEEVVFS